MRWRIPLMLALVAFGITACDQQPPTAVEEDVLTTTTPSFAMGGLGAVVTKGDIGCGIIDGNGDNFPPLVGGMYNGNCWTEVGTWSRNGNAVWIMHATGVPNPTGKTIHYGPYDVGSGDVLEANADLAPGPYPCYLLGADRDFDNFLATINWHEVLTPSGEATITCIYSEKFAFPWPD